MSGGPSPAGDRVGLPASERVAFVILLAVVGVRPLVSESYDAALPAVVQAVDLPPGPGPLFPATIGTLTLLAGVLVAWARRTSGIPWRSTGLALGAACAAIGVAASMFAASHRPLALTASIDWFVGVAMGWLLVQVMRRPWQVRLLAYVLAASASAFALQCALQRYVEMPETVREYESHRAEFWAKQGIALDDPQVTLYERRLRSAEVGGYLPHPNVAAGYLLLAGFAAAAAARMRQGTEQPVARLTLAILAVACFAGIALTGSRGAALAGAVAAGVGLPFVILTRRFARRGRWMSAWAAALLIAAGVVVYAKQSPPWSSMGVRWNYWSNTAALVRDYLWTGVGAQNFGRFYLQYKSPTSTEEIQDPHNFLAAAQAQWGAPGAVGVFLMLVGMSLRLSRSGGSPAAEPTAGGGPRVPAIWFAAVAAGVFGLRLWTVAEYAPGYVFYTTLTPLLIWSAVAAVGCLDLRRAAPADGPVPSSARTVLVLGLAAFLLHAMIDVTFFYPATMTTFFAAAALALAIDGPDAGEGVRPHPFWQAAAPAVAGAAWLAHFVFVWTPANRLQGTLSAARRAAAVETGDPLKEGNALRLYAAAAQANVWDPTAPAELSEWLSSRAAAMEGRAAGDELHRVLDEAVRWAGVAAARDPKNIAVYRSLVDLHALRERLFDRVLDARAAVGAAQMAADLYPGSPRERLVLADRLAALAQREPSPELFDAAIEQYDNALMLDAARPGQQEIRRWPPEFRRAVEARRESVRRMKTQALASRPANTQP